MQAEPLEFQRKTTMTMSNISLLIASARLSALDASVSDAAAAAAPSTSSCSATVRNNTRDCFVLATECRSCVNSVNYNCDARKHLN